MGGFLTKVANYPVDNLDDNDFIHIDELKESNLMSYEKKNYVEAVNSTEEAVNSTEEAVNSTEEAVNSTEEAVNSTEEAVNSTEEAVNSTEEAVNSTEEAVNSTKEAVNSTEEAVNSEGKDEIEENFNLSNTIFTVISKIVIVYAFYRFATLFI